MCAEAGRVCAALAQDILWEVGLEGSAAGAGAWIGSSGLGLQGQVQGQMDGGNSLLERALSPQRIRVAVTARLVPGAHTGFVPRTDSRTAPPAGLAPPPPVASPLVRRGRAAARAAGRRAEESLDAARASERDAAAVREWSGMPEDGSGIPVSDAAMGALEAGSIVLWRGVLGAAEDVAADLRELYDAYVAAKGHGASGDFEKGSGPLPVARALRMEDSEYIPDGDGHDSVTGAISVGSLAGLGPGAIAPVLSLRVLQVLHAQRQGCSATSWCDRLLAIGEGGALSTGIHGPARAMAQELSSGI